MESIITQYLAIATAFIWVGLILGISFLEAWLKFRAPGVTTAIGLGIGRLVFGALNKLEWLLTLVLILTLFTRQIPLLSDSGMMLSVIVVVLLTQTLWLLPALNKRAFRVINDRPVKPSGLHVIFIAAELAKIVLLVLTGISLLNVL